MQPYLKSPGAVDSSFNITLRFIDEKLIHGNRLPINKHCLKLDKNWYIYFRSNVYEWLEENKIDYKIQYHEELINFSIIFTNLNNAILFKLTWCGNV
jgi:hypothetical protein